MTLPILVNSCDKFRDCWDPFFFFWRKFGFKKIDYRLYLNTERADYSYEGLDVTACKVCEKGNWQGKGFPTWSWCTRKAVEQMEGEFFIYMQEDYFLTRQTDDDYILSLIQRMKEDPSIHNINLTDQGLGFFVPSDREGLKKGDPVRSCYASLQAVLWRRDTFLSLLRDAESAWDFETWAKRRAHLTGLNFYMPDRTEMPMVYIFTGVIQGKWYKPVVPLFAEHGIEMDFSVRGMYEGPFGKREGRFWAYWKKRIQLNYQSRKRRFFPLTSWAECLRLRFFGK